MRGRTAAAAAMAVVVSGWVLGCGNARTEQAADTAAVQETAAPAQDDEAPVAAQPARLKVPEGAELASVQVEGKLGCGHCDFHVKDVCSLAMKSTDGTVYLLEAGDRQDELMDKRLDGPQVAVTGNVTEVDGQKVITTESVELR